MQRKIFGSTMDFSREIDIHGHYDDGMAAEGRKSFPSAAYYSRSAVENSSYPINEGSYVGYEGNLDGQGFERGFWNGGHAAIEVEGNRRRMDQNRSVNPLSRENQVPLGGARPANHFGNSSFSARKGMGAGSQLGRTVAPGNVTVCVGAKGGIGKTTISANLAAAFGEPVVLIDLDIPYSNISTFLRFNPTKTWRDWVDSDSLLSQTSQLKDNIYLISCPVTGKDLQIPTVDKVEDVIYKMQTNFGFKNIIIDCGASMDEYTRLACSMATTILLISTPDQVSIMNTLKFINLVRKDTMADIKLVLNRVPRKLMFKPEELTELSGGYPVEMMLPDSKEVGKLTLKGELMVEKYRKSKWSKTIIDFVERQKNEERGEDKTSFFRKLFG